jgi:hypothetical protein
MRIISLAVLFIILSGCASTGRGQFVYFPDLAEKVLAGDPKAFRQVLSQASVTAPGESLEELAEIASKFVRISPKEFLQGESYDPHCFGVSFLGPDYVDNPEAMKQEIDLRRTALQSIDDPSLLVVKERCLVELVSD